MRVLAFASRNQKELVREPINLVIGIGLPLITLLLFAIIQKNMQETVQFSLYNIENLVPGIAVFSFSFISLFSGLLIGRDRSTSYLLRVFASPLTASDYILGYTLPLLPFAMAQTAVCFISGFFFGLPVNVNVLIDVIVLVPIAALYIGLGLLFGTLFTDKQVGGIFGVFVNIAAWLSGTWFDLGMIGGAFKTFAYALPFAHAVDAAKAALAGNYGGIGIHLLWVAGYAVVVFAVAIWIFRKKMKG